MQLLLQPVFHNLWQRLPIQLMGPVVADIRKLFIAVFYHRRTLVRPHRRHHVDHIRNQVGIGNHHFLGLVAAKIGKLIQHFLRGAQIQGRLIVRVREPLSGHNNAAVNLILRIQEMYVAGGHNKLVKLLSQPHNLPVDLLYVLHGGNVRCPLRLDHKPVVAKRLDFQIIIKIHKPCYLRVGLLLQKRPVKLSRLAGASQNQSLPVLRKKALWYSGSSGKIRQVGLRHQTVQIHAAHIVFRQNDRMIGRQLFDDIGTGLSPLVDL